MIVISLVLGVAIHDNQPNDNKYYEQIGSETKDITDEIPFDIPNNWEWVRLGNIVDICDNVRKPLNAEERNKKYKSGDVIYPYYGATGQVDTINNFIFDGTYVLLGEDGAPFLDAYATKAYKVCGKFWVNNHAHIMSSTINNDYLVFCLNITNYKEYVAGTTRLKLTQADMYMIPIPLPPLSEQKRIVSEIEKIFEQIEVVKTNQEELSKLKDGLKNKILDLAIQGKLVEQDPNDEPAAKLLEKIKAEKTNLVKQGKIKKDKQESFIFKTPDNRHYGDDKNHYTYFEQIGSETKEITEEIPFEIPDSWEWVRFKNIFNIISSKRVLQSDWKSEGIPFYRAREIARLAEFGFVNNELYISEELFNELSKAYLMPEKNDIMLSAVGTIGKAYIVKDSDRFYYKDASVLCYKNYSQILPEYAKLFIESNCFVSQYAKDSGGTTVDTLTIIRANQYVIPLPPLSEQKRIVAKVDELLSVIKFL